MLNSYHSYPQHWHHSTVCYRKRRSGSGPQLRRKHSNQQKVNSHHHVYCCTMIRRKSSCCRVMHLRMEWVQYSRTVWKNGSDKPVAFASRSLSPAEKNYAQLEKEGLAIIFGVRKFHQYLLGRRFTILSDHKPLQHLFSESRPVPPMASARIQRWALILGAYDYTISYKPGSKHANADSLSRLPLPKAPAEVPTPEEVVLLMETIQNSPVNAAQIRQWTDRDPLLSKVRKLILQGWEKTKDNDLLPYFRRKMELSVQEGCVLWGS